MDDEITNLLKKYVKYSDMFSTIHVTQEGPANALALNKDYSQVVIAGRNGKVFVNFPYVIFVSFQDSFVHVVELIQ